MKGLPLRIFEGFILRPKDDKHESQEEETKHGTNSSPIFNQTLVALGPLILTITAGMTFGYSAILLPQLQSVENTIFTITKEDAVWIASMAALPMAIGCAFGGIALETLGRKTTHVICCLPMFLGWFLMYLANGTTMILIGRFITGFITGILASAVGIYIGETSQPSYRGFLLAAMAFSISLGMFLSHLFGTFFSWQTTALICSILPLFSQIIICFTPESPSWLASRGKIKEAEESFYWCRGKKEEAQQELARILERNNEQPKEENVSLKEKLNNLLVPEFLKPLGIISVYIVANQWSGINAMTFYYVTIMKDTIGKDIDEYLAMLLVDFLRLFMSTVACVLLKKYSRRPLAIISGIGAFTSLLILSLYSYLIKSYPEIITGYVPMACLACFIIFVCIGFLPLPWAMMGEVFPLKHRSIGSGISSFVAFATFFSVVKCLPSMFQEYGPSGTFLTFGLIAFIGTVFVCLFLPETKGRTLQEIEDAFKNKKQLETSNESTNL